MNDEQIKKEFWKKEKARALSWLGPLGFVDAKETEFASMYSETELVHLETRIVFDATCVKPSDVVQRIYETAFHRGVRDIQDKARSLFGIQSQH